jgi:hypothetical protein
MEFSTDTEFAIAGALAHSDPATVGEIACALCSALLIPHPTGNLFTSPMNCWWVCDDCGRQHAPEQMALLDRLRSIVGDVLVRQVDANEIYGERGRPEEVGICPRCGVDFQDGDPPRGCGRWMIVCADTDRPLCAECSTVMPDICDVVRELEADLR